MADTVSVRVVSNTTSHYEVVLNNNSDGTGESAIAKVDKSTLTGLTGAEPTHLALELLEANIAGFKAVTLLWDHATTDVVIVNLPTGNTEMHFCESCLEDPAPGTDAGTGDILLTTNTNAAGNAYCIRLRFKKIK